MNGNGHTTPEIDLAANGAPYDQQAELGLISALLVAHWRFDEVADLTPAHFRDDGLKIIFRAMHAANNNGAKPDAAAVMQKLGERPADLEAIGVLGKIKRLVTEAVTDANLTYYADILRKKHKLRELQLFGLSLWAGIDRGEPQA